MIQSPRLAARALAALIIVSLAGFAAASETQFVDHDYIELPKIGTISRFRSHAGHDYSADDSDETCRSMKHYYVGRSGVVWEGITIFSPVDGTVLDIRDESTGDQIHIISSLYPEYIFKLFHVVQTGSLSVSDSVSAGQILGHHYGISTNSDIAVVKQPVAGDRQLVSFFEVMSDRLFHRYQRRGVASRDAMIISKEVRDLDLLYCVGETFTAYPGNEPSWVELNSGGGLFPLSLLLDGAAGW